jgi:hypothetical protein
MSAGRGPRAGAPSMTCGLQRARHCDPLTLLPGSVPLSEDVHGLRDTDADVHVADFDLEPFKPFRPVNDLYGFDRGGAVISTRPSASAAPAMRTGRRPETRAAAFAPLRR